MNKFSAYTLIHISDFSLFFNDCRSFDVATSKRFERSRFD